MGSTASQLGYLSGLTWKVWVTQTGKNEVCGANGFDHLTIDQLLPGYPVGKLIFWFWYFCCLPPGLPNSICIQNFGCNAWALSHNNNCAQLKIRRPWVYRLLGTPSSDFQILQSLDSQAREIQELFFGQKLIVPVIFRKFWLQKSV